MKGRAEDHVLDGVSVPTISAFLFPRGGSSEPGQLSWNHARAYGGAFVLGLGFLFDDANTERGSGSLAEMSTLIKENPGNAKRIFPYLGGEELNSRFYPGAKQVHYRLRRDGQRGGHENGRNSFESWRRVSSLRETPSPNEIGVSFGGYMRLAPRNSSLFVDERKMPDHSPGVYALRPGVCW